MGVAASTVPLPMGDSVGGFIICLSAGVRGRSLIYSMRYRWTARVGVQGHAVSLRVSYRKGNVTECLYAFLYEISRDRCVRQPTIEETN